jgi:hypothetical protein
MEITRADTGSVNVRTVNISYDGIAFTIPDDFVKVGDEVVISIATVEIGIAIIRWVTNTAGMAGAQFKEIMGKGALNDLIQSVWSQ